MSNFQTGRTAFEETPSDRHQEISHREGPVARRIEEETAKIPSDTYLWAAGAAVLGSWLLQCAGKEHASLFIGQWVAPTLIVGLYNKLVKVAGSDQSERRGDASHMM